MIVDRTPRVEAFGVILASSSQRPTGRPRDRRKRHTWQTAAGHFAALSDGPPDATNTLGPFPSKAAALDALGAP